MKMLYDVLTVEHLWMSKVESLKESDKFNELIQINKYWNDVLTGK